MFVHVFLFTDMLLITKPVRRGGDKYTIAKPVSLALQWAHVEIQCNEFFTDSRVNPAFYDLSGSNVTDSIHNVDFTHTRVNTALSVCTCSLRL